MRPARCLLLLALLGLLAAPPAISDDSPGTAAPPAPAATPEAAPKPKAVEFGEVVADFEGPDPAGNTVRLSDLEITKEKAEAAVLAEAKDVAGEATPTLETGIADLAELSTEGALDEELRNDFVARVGRRFGLLPSEAVQTESKTLQDLVTWILASQDAPIAVVVWSPRCPMCKNIYDERMQEILAESGVPLLAIAGNTPDTAEHVTAYLEDTGYRWKVILDPEQKIVDKLGGRKTPHVFLLDKDRKLVYRGTVDNDPRDELEGAERKEYLRQAIQAAKNGGTPEERDTEPAG